MTTNRVQIDLYSEAASSLILHLQARTTGASRVLRVSGRRDHLSWRLRGGLRLDVPVLVPQGRSTLTLTVSGAPLAYVRGPSVVLSSTWFTRAAQPGGGIRPVPASADSGFGKSVGQNG